MTNRANAAATIGRMHHVSIQTRDWDASLAFYGEVLGLPRTSNACLANGKQLVLFGSPASTRVELVSPPPGEPPPMPEGGKPAIAHLAFEVEDLTAVLERIRSHGLRVLVEPTRIDTEGLHATIAFFEGPNGESIELITDHAGGSSDG